MFQDDFDTFDGQAKVKRADLSDAASDYGKMMLDGEGEFYGEISIPRYIGIGSWRSSTAEKTQESDEETPLSHLEAASVVCLLQDAIDELIILKYVVGAPLVLYNLNYRTPKERYTRKLTPVRIFPEMESVPVFTSAIKLQRDRATIEAVFNKLTKALIDNRTYSPLSNFIRGLRSEEEDDNSLVRELRSNLDLVKELKVKVQEKRKVDEREEKEREELMYQLQDELDGVALKCEVEEKFVSKWEGVRQAQNMWKLQEVETYLRDSINECAKNTELEGRVTYEIQSYLKICQTELEDKLEEWMAKHDSETEKRENRIVRLKFAVDQQEEKKHELRILYEDRCTKMKKWIEFRELRKARAAASLTIQSWWRGIIVRKKLSLKKLKKAEKKGKGKKKK